MSDPRFTPRRFATEPNSFGRARVISWLDENDDENKKRSGDERDRFAAARLQSQFAFLIRSRVRRKYKTLKAYADACGVPYDRLSKVMRGEVIMRFEDVVQAERILGEILRTGFDAIPSAPHISGLTATSPGMTSDERGHSQMREPV